MVLLPLYRCKSHKIAATLMHVRDQDWLENGHGGGEGLRPMIKGSSRQAGDRVSVRGVLRGTDSAEPRRPRRRTKALVGWMLYCCTAVGGTAAAFTVRDTLFPSLGGPTKPALWASSQADSTLTTEHGSTTVDGSDDTIADPAVVTTPGSTASLAIEAETTPSVSTDAGPGNSVDNHGSGGGVPQTGTTVNDNPSSGPGPGTTVGDHPSETSVPGSASTPPTAADTSTSSTLPGAGDPADPGHQGGKGGGGGGSGGGSGGGGGGSGGDGGRPSTP